MQIIASGLTTIETTQLFDFLTNYFIKEEVETKRVVSIEDLEHMIEDAINNEEYEIAAEIRDRIEKLKKEGK